MIRFGIVGGGWRTEFYLRAAQALGKDRARVTGLAMRSPEKAALMERRFGVKTCGSWRELLKDDPAFIVVALPWQPMADLVRGIVSECDIPVLCETPIAPDEEQTREMYRFLTWKKARVQVAEQYFMQPYHRAVKSIIDSGVIGEVTDLYLSMMHGYHGVSILRTYLGTGLMPVTLSGRRFTTRVTRTCGRNGLDKGGELITMTRDDVLFEYDDGRYARYEFSDEQYFSGIRSRTVRINGTRGEIADDTVRYINDEGDCVTEKLVRADLGQYSDLQGYSLRGLMFGGKYVYKNPFAEKKLSDNCRLSDDELAVAEMLLHMQEYADGGKEFYPLAEACHDTVLSNALKHAAEGRTVRVEGLEWM